jgi:hypothetical protein
LVLLALMSLNVEEFLVNQAKCLLQTGRGNIIWADAEEELVNLTLMCSYSPFNNLVPFHYVSAFIPGNGQLRKPLRVGQLIRVSMRIDVVVQGQLPCFVEPVTRKSFRQSVKPAYRATCTSSSSNWLSHSIDGVRRFPRTLKIAFGYRALIIGRCTQGSSSRA